MAKIWDKGKETNQAIDDFTVGNDRELDLLLAEHDVVGSMAHITMLESIGLLQKEELIELLHELKKIHAEILDGNFEIEEGMEDVHSQVEMMLIDRLGDVGKKIHSGRSRNDQVLVDLKLYMRGEIQAMAEGVESLAKKLLELSETHKDKLMPGYTHMQLAMPSSFGLWFGAYAESLVDDLHGLIAAHKVVNKNPLGSAAGYGSSFPLDRQMTTDLLGFEDMNVNVVYAQMGRGKAEKVTATAMAGIASTLSKLALDVCLFMNQNFGFVTFPDELTTGSSIMPHKKNPDVWELIRGKSNKLKALPNEIDMITGNLPTGYHREMQLLKENLFPAFDDLADCLEMAEFMLGHIEVKKDILEDDMYKFLFSVDLVNQKVLDGKPFRDAYKEVGEEISSGSFDPPRKTEHSHEGSIGNLGNERIASNLAHALKEFHFEVANEAVAKLLS